MEKMIKAALRAAGEPLATDEVAAAIGRPVRVVGVTLSGMRDVDRHDVVDANTNARMFTMWTLPDATHEACTQDVGFNADCGADATMIVDGLAYCTEHGERVETLIALADALPEED